MKLLIDIGNTRLKWDLAEGGRFTGQGVIAHEGAPLQAFAALPDIAPESVWIAQVAGVELEEPLSAVVRRRYGLLPQFARSSPEWNGLHNAYREPLRLGVDRWLAMIAAWQIRRGAACVVDAGTALTADVIDANGRHLGGFIAAGLQTQQRAILGATRFATRRIDATRYRSGLGDDTESCVRQGALLACVGAIERAAAQTAPDALCLIGGGDAESLLPHLGPRWQHEPLLVPKGLLAVSGA